MRLFIRTKGAAFELRRHVPMFIRQSVILARFVFASFAQVVVILLCSVLKLVSLKAIGTHHSGRAKHAGRTIALVAPLQFVILVRLTLCGLRFCLVVACDVLMVGRRRGVLDPVGKVGL